MTYCLTCGSREIQIEAWIYANNWKDMRDGEVTGSGSEGPGGQCYCANCEAADNDGGYTSDRREAAAARLAYRREHGAKCVHDDCRAPAHPYGCTPFWRTA